MTNKNIPPHESTQHEKNVVKSEIATRTLLVIATISSIIIIILLATLLVSISHTTDAIRTTQKKEAPTVGDIRTELLKCSAPGGECYKASKKNQDRLIKYIVDVNTATGYCSKLKKVKTYEDLNSCISSKVKEP